jgi:4-hydroxy-tetrahydrodipicolinate reductase
MIVVGAAGRMGQALVRAVAGTPGAILAAALERPGSSALGQDAGTLAGLAPLGILVSDDPLTVFPAADVLLDFTTPAATTGFAALAAQTKLVHVIGTTGLADSDMAKLQAAARHTAIVQSGNMSLGVNLLAALVKQASAALDPSYDIEVLEMHHRMKVDAPSGTALLLGEAAARGRSVALQDAAVRVRDGHTGPRQPGSIGFASLRGGTVVGEHSVIFAGSGERIVLSHVAEDRGNFAQGAVRAGMWAKGRRPGLYSMMHVLGLEPVA